MKFKNFFIKEKEIVLECFTYLNHAYDYAKIDYAHKYVPDWWKKTPGQLPELTKGATIKHCTGLIDYYKKGIVIPSWFEFELSVAPIGGFPEWEWRSSNSDLDTSHSHVQLQFMGFAGQHGHNIKIVSPWALRTKEEVYFTWTEPLWNMVDYKNTIKILPAVVNYKYNHASEINLFIEQKDFPQRCTIPALNPLVIMHPLTERPIKLVHHNVTKDEYARLFGIDKMIMRDTSHDSSQIYNRKKKLHQKIEERESGCPFRPGKR